MITNHLIPNLSLFYISYHDVEEGEDDCCEDEEAEAEVGEHDEGDDGDACQGQSEVARKLVRDHSVRLPGCVDLHRKMGHKLRDYKVIKYQRTKGSNRS